MGLYKRGSVWWMSFINPNTGEQERRSTETEDKEQAKRIFDKIKGQIAEGKWFERLPGQDYTFKEAMDKYLTGYSQRSKAASSHVRDQCGAKHLLPAFGEYILADIGPSIISEYKVKRREAGASAQTVNLELSLMSHVFTIAMKEWEWVKENPVRMVSRERKDRSKERWLTLEEEGRLLRNVAAMAPGHHHLCYSHGVPSKRDLGFEVVASRLREADHHDHGAEEPGRGYPSCR